MVVRKIVPASAEVSWLGRGPFTWTRAKLFFPSFSKRTTVVRIRLCEWTYAKFILKFGMPLVAAHEIPSLGHIHNDVLCPLFLERRNKEKLCSTWHSSEWLIDFFYEAEALKVFIDRTNVEMETRSWWGGCEVLGDLGIVYLDSNIVKPYYTKYCNYLELSSSLSFHHRNSYCALSLRTGWWAYFF